MRKEGKNGLSFFPSYVLNNIHSRFFDFHSPDIHEGK